MYREPRANCLRSLGVRRLERRWLALGGAALCIALLPGCGGTDTQQPSLNHTVSVPGPPAKTEPEKTPDESGKSGANGNPSTTSRPNFYQLDELEQVVAALASDDPAEKLTRVWIRKDALQGAAAGPAGPGPAVDVVLSNSLVTDEGLAQLARIPRLRHLNLDDCREITSAGMAHLAGLTHLRKLSLNRTAVDDAGLAHLAALPTLTELSLVGNAGVTDAGAAHLARCPALKVLQLQDTRVGDQGLAHLKAARELRELRLDGSRVTERGMADFHAARKDVQIVHPLRRKRAPQS